MDEQAPKRTKIIATLGPATDDLSILQKMIDAGLNCVRLNFSHGSIEKHQQRLQQVRSLAAKNNVHIGVIADLQGPKIRIACFKQGKVILTQGKHFILDADLDDHAGNEIQVGIDYKALPKDVTKNDILLLDDGRLIFKVLSVKNSRIDCEVLVGGELSDHKGINRQGGGLSAAFLTEKDHQDLKRAVAMEVDYIAVSFPRDSQDIAHVRQLINNAGGGPSVIAKIERSEAIKKMDSIIKAADAIIVARGDLGVEIGDAELPSIQKMIIHHCRNLNRAVITATQMMESMRYSTIPTRAEVFDVANAVMDGTDAVMLSAETATGQHPDIVVAAMARICRGAEKNRLTKISRHRMESQFSRIDEAIAMATMYTANHLKIKCIIALTESGSTTLWMSRIRSGIPIYALSRNVSTLRRVTLYRGVYPIFFDPTTISSEHVNQATIQHMQKCGVLHSGDRVILTKGDHMGIHGGTNAMKIMVVE